MKKRVALITHDLSLVGGLPTMITFLNRVLVESGRYESELISLATSAADQSSVKLRSPATWFQGPRIEESSWHDSVFTHAGVWVSELEFQRYRPRRKLVELLKSFDALQFVVGSPPWACVAQSVGRPVFLWTATTTRADRASRQRNGSFSRRAWSSVMIPLTEQYEKRALRAVDKVFALSEYTRDSVTPIAGREKVTLAPCGVDTDLFRPESSPKATYILSVARFSDARKNVRLLLEAYSRLRGKIRELPELCLVGEPPNREVQQQLEQLKIASKVHLVEPKQGEELAALYRNATLFVLSSDEEGLGIVILEAMASGLAVVSTNCGGPSTAIAEGHTGLLTPIGDAEALSEAMARLLRDSSLREQMGRAGRTLAEEKFSIEAAGKIFLDTYDKFIHSCLPADGEQRLQKTILRERPTFPD